MKIKLTLAAASAALATTAIGLPAEAISIGSSYTIAGQGKFTPTSIDFINNPLVESATGQFSSLNPAVLSPGFKLAASPGVFDISAPGSGLLVDFIDSPNILGVQSFNIFDFTATTATYISGLERYKFTGFFGDGTKAVGELAQLVAVEGSPGVFGYSATFTAVPTPALLPGLIGLGVAALRRKGEESTEENA